MFLQDNWVFVFQDNWVKNPFVLKKTVVLKFFVGLLGFLQDKWVFVGQMGCYPKKTVVLQKIVGLLGFFVGQIRFQYIQDNWVIGQVGHRTVSHCLKNDPLVLQFQDKRVVGIVGCRTSGLTPNQNIFCWCILKRCTVIYLSTKQPNILFQKSCALAFI